MYLSGGFELFGDALVAAEDSTVRVGWNARLRLHSGSRLTNRSALAMANGAQDAESVDRLGVGADLTFCDTQWKKDDRKYGQIVIAGNLCTYPLTRRCCNFHRKRVKRAEPCGAPPSRLGRATKRICRLQVDSLELSSILDGLLARRLSCSCALRRRPRWKRSSSLRLPTTNTSCSLL
jgi:hypothetical protein